MPRISDPHPVDARKSDLAQLVSDGFSISGAAQWLGLTSRRGYQLWQLIVDDLAKDGGKPF